MKSVRQLAACVLVVIFACQSPAQQQRPAKPAERDWSRAMVDSTLQRNPDVKTFGGWGYAKALFLLGQYFVYKRTHDQRYLDYITGWLDQHIDENGKLDRDITALDYIFPAVLIVIAWQETHQPRYKLAAEIFRHRFDDYPRTSDGGFWHATSPSRQWQLWADGAFMGMEFLIRYGQAFNDSKYANDEAAKQILVYASHLRDPNTGLLFHAYDESGKQEWADPVTHHSAEFWGRAMGWFGMITVDLLDVLPRNHPKRAELITFLQGFVKALAKYQDPQTGLWYQVVDKGSTPGNWLETSESSMYTYTTAVAVKRGYVDKSYQAVADRGYRGVLTKLAIGDDGLVNISDIGEGTNVSDLAYYFARKRNVNDFHGLGAFLLMNEEHVTGLGSMQQHLPAPRSFTLEVRNPTATARVADDVVVTLNEVRRLAPEFNPDFARLTVRTGSKDVDVPFQADDLDADGVPDELAFQLDLAPLQTRAVTVTYGRELAPAFPARTHAQFTKHFDGLAWESERAAWRIYFDKRNAIDLFGKRKPGLYLEAFAQPDSKYQDESPTARDIFAVGKSAGIGSIGALVDGKLVRVADVADRQWRIVSTGPVRTIVEQLYKGWKAGDSTLDLTSRMTQWAGERGFQHTVRATSDSPPLVVALPHGPGFHQPAGGRCALATWGEQVVEPGANKIAPLPQQNLGVAVLVPTATRACLLESDPDNYLGRVPLQDHSASWYVFAAWDQEVASPGTSDAARITTQPAFDRWFAQRADRIAHPATVAVHGSANQGATRVTAAR